MATVTVRNGIDVQALLDTIDAIKAKPELAGSSPTRSAPASPRSAPARVKAPRASETELQELCTYVQETSPVRDVVANGVPVSTSIEVLP